MNNALSPATVQPAQSFTAQQQQFMARALQLAERGRVSVAPNPMVGCVIVNQDQVVGEGWHLRAGEAHAEVLALEMAGARARGATVYVTLEPCSHTGRTGPCADALIEAGVSELIYASQDPNPAVAGEGLERLQAAGITVCGPLLEAQARQLNRGFFKRHEQSEPWISVKTAMSLDGRTAMASGQSQWITSPAARADVQQLRARSCAVVTGIGTVSYDDPSMTVRDVAAEDGAIRQPLRVVVDSQLRLCADAALLKQPGPILVATLRSADEPQALQLRAAKSDLEILTLAADGGRVNLAALVAALTQRGCNELLVEAGAGLAGAFVGAGLIDELVCYVAPKLFGSDARPMFDLPIVTIDAHLALSMSDCRQIGEDLRLTFSPDKDY
ncbi:MAG: bifunctional diaminohydroxyphosphoribosylaminopyrimidine deaminase/5-amino-6-(5-phosphoribosylamino)uracil reductase RibD [Porticoccaceae bacterium]